VPTWGEHLWDTSFGLADDSFVGRSLHALIGYSARPSGIQLAAYLATLGVLVAASRAPPAEQGQDGDSYRRGCTCGPGALRPRPDLPVMVFHNHASNRRIEMPTDQKLKLLAKNTDDTVDEFESVELKRGDLMKPGQQLPCSLGPIVEV
jgi:hypothetical protein